MRKSGSGCIYIPSEGTMSVVQLPDHLKQIIERYVAKGRVEDETAYLEEAVRRYAEDLEADDEIAVAAKAGILDIEAGRYVTVSSLHDAEELHDGAMARLRARLAADSE
jgi:Arc/MetJ-type ribon-helix-helix transcriptional regulator